MNSLTISQYSVSCLWECLCHEHLMIVSTNKINSNKYFMIYIEIKLYSYFDRHFQHPRCKKEIDTVELYLFFDRNAIFPRILHGGNTKIIYHGGNIFFIPNNREYEHVIYYSCK